MSHYDGPGGAVAWSTEEAGSRWTRSIPGLDGSLTAVERSGEETKPVLQLHDLEGDIVGEAADNENETKLLKTYNSTEFGVPSGKAPPPKYAWLGAAGVAGELSSGVITQDGVTYVPQTGRPLQSEGLALLAIGNATTPFTRPVEEWVGSKAGEGAAREIAKAEQERVEREQANQPPGETPSPWSEGPGGFAPYGGEEALAGECAGGGACTASYTTCALHWLFGEPEGGVLAEAVGVRCTGTVSTMRYEACFWSWLDHGSDENNKNYHQFSCRKGNKSNKAKGAD